MSECKAFREIPAKAEAALGQPLRANNEWPIGDVVALVFETVTCEEENENAWVLVNKPYEPDSVPDALHGSEIESRCGKPADIGNSTLVHGGCDCF